MSKDKADYEILEAGDNIIVTLRILGRLGHDKRSKWFIDCIIQPCQDVDTSDDRKYKLAMKTDAIHSVLIG